MCRDYKTGGYRRHCKECEKLRIRNYRKCNKDKYLKKAKEHSRKRLYGITQQEYEILLGIFPNCPICGETFTSSFVPHVDHDGFAPKLPIPAPF